MELHMTKSVNDKFWAYIDQCPDEIGGIGYVRLDGDRWTWYEIFLIEQEVSGTSVDYTDAGMASAIERAAADGVLGDPDHAWVIWHSHVNMNAYWSGTDVKEQIHRFRDTSGLPWLFSVVGNKKREYQARLDLWDHPLVDSITFDKVELQVIADSALREEVQAEIDSLVTKRKYGQSKGASKSKDDDEYVQGKDGTWRRESRQHELTIDDVIESDWWASIDWTDDDEASAAIEVINQVGLELEDVLDADTATYHMLTGRDIVDDSGVQIVDGVIVDDEVEALETAI